LEPLHINQLLADTLKANPDATWTLAKLCFDKTQGNPFFLNQFLSMMHRSAMISFNQEKAHWVWDADCIQQMPMTDNVVDLMLDKIQQLPPDTQSVLSLAACIGGEFDLAILSIVFGKTPLETANALWEALKAELIVPIGDAYKYIGVDTDGRSSRTPSMNPVYRFNHDRIQQAAYTLIPDDAKADTHWKIGILMQKTFSESELEQKLFDVVDHLNQGFRESQDPSERRRVADLNYRAGLKAKASSAYGPALTYLEKAIELLGDAIWQADPKTAIEIYTQATEAAYLNRDFDDTERFANIVLDHATQLIDQVKIYEIKIESLIDQSRIVDAIRLAIGVLSMLGIRVPENPKKLEFAIVFKMIKWHLRRKKIDNIVNLPDMHDPYKLACARILSTMFVSGSFFNHFWQLFHHLNM
jgi:predicted ATPase